LKKKRRRTNRRPLLLIGLGFFLMIGALVIWALANPEESSQNGSLSGQSTPVASQVERVSLQEAKTAFDQGQAVFLDVRSAEDYAASHIPGAISIPINELNGRANELDPDEWIVTYCT
jgi:3-mercaptopyruvate sulfurtransferase SseA